MTVFNEKKEYTKKHVIFSTTELGVISPEEYLFAFWDDPSRPVLAEFIGMLTSIASGLVEEEGAEEIVDSINTEDFYKLASEIMLDSNIKGLDFSTAESTQAAFESRDISSGFLSEVLSKYVLQLVEELANQKNS